MKIFQCGHCSYPLYFENQSCENCDHLTGYRDTDRIMLTFDPSRELLISDREQIEYKFCKNKEFGVCNWVIESHDPHEYCRACQLNRTIPNLQATKNFDKWRNLEIAKHRLIYQLQKIGLTLLSKNRLEEGFCFDFVEKQNDANLMTGHADGVITILLREADPVVREQTRLQLFEPYRTLIGHLRHETGHYFWDRLVMNDQQRLTEFRDLFGNEEIDYSEALNSYYKEGAPDDWQTNFISQYASSHAWEDWAETWAHYLHIMDIVETAYFFGIHVRPQEGELNKADVTFDPYTVDDFQVIINTCVPLSFAVNSITRAMGVPDVYPFVIAPAVVDKMAFIHKLLLPKRNLS